MRLIGLVLGSGNTLNDDRAAALQLIGDQGYLVIACNHAARDHAGPLDHWATMHPELLPKWIGERHRAGRPAAGRIWVPNHRQRFLNGLEASSIQSWGGSSGMLCAQVAMAVGCERIILAGVPMHQNACHYDMARPWREARQYWGAWERNRGAMMGRVRSMSGWTAKLLGVPNEGWLHGDEG